MIRLSFSGDLFVADSFRGMIGVPGIFRSCDYNLVCLEGPICDSKIPPFPKTGPNLCQHEDVQKILGAFSHVTLANNHIMDYGLEGLQETVDFLDKHNIQYAGAGREYPNMYEPMIIQKQDVRVAVFCLAEAQYGCCKNEMSGSNGGYAWMLNPLIFKKIQEYLEKVDHVIMYLHGGLEGEDYPLVEWRHLYRGFIDYGADLVIASHPHVIQGKEIYKGKSIYYSIGNLFFNNETFLSTPAGRTSIIVDCSIDKNNLITAEYFAEFDKNSIHDAPSFAKERFEKLSEILLPQNEKQYKHACDEMVLSCWERYYKGYYSFPRFHFPDADGIIGSSWNRLLRKLVKKIVYPPVSLNQLYHNINIDTHRFAVSRALALLSQTY